MYTFNHENSLFVLPSCGLFRVGRVVPGAVYTLGGSLTLAKWEMFKLTTVDAYRLSVTLVFVVAKHLTLITMKLIRDVYINVGLQTKYLCVLIHI